MKIAISEIPLLAKKQIPEETLKKLRRIVYPATSILVISAH